MKLKHAGISIDSKIFYKIVFVSFFDVDVFDRL